MQKIYVKPADPATSVRDHRGGQILPPEGKLVADDIYWRRRVRDGSCIISTAGPAPKGSGVTKAKPKAKETDR